MKFRKNSGSKKREKSLEISRFPAARITERLIPPLGFMAGIAGLEPTKCQSQNLVPYQLGYIPTSIKRDILCFRMSNIPLS